MDKHKSDRILRKKSSHSSDVQTGLGYKRLASPPPITLENLIDYTPAIAPKWYCLGIKLGQSNKVKELCNRQEEEQIKCCQLLDSWINAGDGLKWETLLEALSSDGVKLHNVARKIIEKYNIGYSILQDQTTTSSATLTNRQASSTLKEKLEMIKENKLGLVWADQEDKEKKIKHCVDDYFMCLPASHNDLEIQEVDKEIESLYENESLLTANVYAHAKKKIIDLQNASAPLVKEDTHGQQKEEILFSKENIYHSLICCKALESKKDVNTYFKKNCTQHRFRKLSKSHGQNSILIAKKETSVYIAAFRIPEKAIDCFDAGFEVCDTFLQDIPTNMFVKLLSDDQQLVLTGYSFGGSLAQAVFARMLKGNLFNQDFLISNVCCITFGEPISCNSFLAEEMRKRQNLMSCFHHIYLENDLHTRAVQDLSLRSLVNSQGKVSNSMCYISNTSVSTHPPWTAMHKAEFLKMLFSKRHHEILRESAKVPLEDYFYEIFATYIDQPPAYMLPTMKEQAIPPLDLQPAVMSVEIHRYDKELCIIVSGRNLWFSRKLVMPSLEISQDLCIHENTGLQFQFQAEKEISVENHPGKIQLKLENTLFDTLEVTVPVEIKIFDMTVRQVQLAQLSPKDLTQIAILSAALEKRNTLIEGSTPSVYSKRFIAIKGFLEIALDVVPIESLSYAINSLSESGLPGPEYSYCLQLLGSCGSKIHDIHSHSTPVRVYVPAFHSKDPNFESDDEFRVHRIAYHNQVSLPPYAWRRERQSVHRVRFTDHPRIRVPKLSGEVIKSLFASHFKLNPLTCLEEARKKLNRIESSSENNKGANIAVLECAESVRQDASNFATLVDGFMGTHMQVPLVQSEEDTAKALESGVSAGVWYLVGLNFGDLQEIVKDRQIVIDVTEYLGRFLQSYHDQKMEGWMSTYVGKVHFMANAMSNTVSCNTSYVSYSLERQLKEHCTIQSHTPVKDIVNEWSRFFKEKILSFVGEDHREIIARWIKWMLAIHDLREALASQTTLGVVGLMNSGKSSLMNKLFGRKIPSGTLESKRTTVPFLYNLGPEVEDMDVVDFPGVDDCDSVIQGLCKILFGLAQLVIYVVDYRKAHSEASISWMKHIANTKPPTLLCLSFGDQLFAEKMKGPTEYPNEEEILQIVKGYQKDFEAKYRMHIGKDPPECMICSINTQNDSVLRLPAAQKKLEEANIKSTKDIQEWIVNTLNRRGQVPLANKMKEFMSRHSKADN